MPGVVPAGHLGGPTLHVTVPLHVPGSVAGTQVGAHVAPAHCSTQVSPGAQSVPAHGSSGTHAGWQVWSQPAELHFMHSSSQCVSTGHMRPALLHVSPFSGMHCSKPRAVPSSDPLSCAKSW